MKYLYHYTNVNTLKIILENGTFRFTSLQNVDDLEEMETENFGNLGRFCYVSCWTDNDKESIPMWKEYTNPLEGIRIKLPVNIFEEVQDIGFTKEQFISMGANMDDLKKFAGFPYTKGLADYEREGFVTFMPRIVELFPVTYTKDSKLLQYSVYNEVSSGTTLETKLIGKFKNIDWKYQSEWRYKLFTFPFGLFDMTTNPLIMGDPQKMLNLLKTVPIKYDHFDIPFNKKSIEGMEILTSPIISSESNDILNSFIESIPKVNIQQSTQRWGR